MDTENEQVTWTRLPHRITGKSDTGKIIAEVCFPETSKGVCTVTECYMDEDYRTTEAVSELLEEASKVIRSRGERMEAEHPYAKKWLKEHGNS